MKWRAKRALLVLLGVVVAGLWLATPLMRESRKYVWSGLVLVVGQGSGLGWFKNGDDLSEQLAALRAENIRLKAEVVDYRRLRDQLGAPAFDDFEGIQAVVVGRPIDTFSSQIVVNKGVDSGIMLGAPAVVQSSILVGFVTELNVNSAVVTLLLHPDNALAVEIVNSEDVEVQGLVEGKNFTSVQLTTVPRDLPLEVGQEIITRGRPGMVPHGLLVGATKEIISEETEIYKSATIDLAFNPDNLRAVVLVTP